MVKDLGIQIDETGKTIKKASSQLDQTKVKLKASLQILYQEERKGGLEILLASKKISDFFRNLVNLEILNEEITQILANVKSAKILLENEKENLDKQKSTLQKTVSVQALQIQQSQQNKKQQETILEQTKGKETLYQQYLDETKKRAAEIRSRIFEIIGVPQAPNFGQAYEIAKFVNSVTGVRPAFLLAVLTQESNIGKNVGQCYLDSDNSGAGIRISTGKKEAKVMKKSDVTLFLQITQELNRDPYHTPISCPIASVGGYGGAMGPAQFIPSTWNIYKSKVKAQTGKAADPWNITDAFLAAGIYLKDLGASTSEWRAAMKYFSGATWTKYEEFYGNNVIAIAIGYEDDIEAIENSLSKTIPSNVPSL
ncbi:MAG: lytic murein transglycosylase, partial [bacterium]|nr:lytic murein transglycosylase [bacterium]